MAWQIVYHAEEPQEWQVGDMWPVPHWANSNIISKRYKEEYSKTRPPLKVILPSSHSKHGDIFLIDRFASDDPNEKGWEVILVGELVDGQTPDITLKPSINCVGSYHGYITNGVITDDCEKRSYPDIVARKPVEVPPHRPPAKKVGGPGPKRLHGKRRGRR